VVTIPNDAERQGVNRKQDIVARIAESEAAGLPIGIFQLRPNDPDAGSELQIADTFIVRNWRLHHQSPCFAA
jgi:hypothetical protein